MPIVRTTFRPDLEIEVGDAELLDLQRQGLLVEDASPEPPAPTTSKKTGTSKES